MAKDGNHNRPIENRFGLITVRPHKTLPSHAPNSQTQHQRFTRRTYLTSASRLRSTGSHGTELHGRRSDTSDDGKARIRRSVLHRRAVREVGRHHRCATNLRHERLRVFHSPRSRSCPPVRRRTRSSRPGTRTCTSLCLRSLGTGAWLQRTCHGHGRTSQASHRSLRFKLGMVVKNLQRHMSIKLKRLLTSRFGPMPIRAR